MRITHVIGSLDPAAGGPPAVVLRLAAAQAKLGANVTVLSWETPGAYARIRESLATIPGIERVTIQLLPKRHALRELARLSWESLGKNRVDFVHLHSVWEPSLLAVSIWTRWSRIPYTIAPHGMLDPWSLSQKALKKRLALLAGYRRMLAGASFVHALNRDEAELMGPLQLPAPVEVIPNGIFLEELDPLPPSGTFRARYPALTSRPFLLFMGRLHHKKGLDYLVNAYAAIARELSEVDLVVVGPDDGELENLTHRIRGLGLEARVHITGPIFGRDRLEALVDAACFCLPSRQEGFSMAILEALACGTPPIISSECHFPEVDAVGAGRVVPLETAALADALTSVVCNLDLRKRMSAKGRELVRAKYTWPAIAEQTLTAYARHRRLP